MVTDFFGNVVPTPTKIANTIRASAAVNGVITGTGDNDQISTAGVGSTAAGGTGDDVYYSVRQGVTILEKAGEGVDTVWVIGNYVLADNIENVVMHNVSATVIGNSLQNYFLGNSYAQTFDGGRGNDVLTGGGGGDTFIFRAQSGYDLITDFRAGVSTAANLTDKVQLAGYGQFTTFDQVLGAMTQSGNDVILTLDGSNAIKFANHAISDFKASNFLLTADLSKLTLTFEDDFDTFSAGSGNASKATWRTDLGHVNDTNSVYNRAWPGSSYNVFVDAGTKGKGTTELGINPFSVEDGILTIHADRTPVAAKDALYGYNYTGGLISTKNSFQQTYGYFEARLQTSTANGVWPAFWLYDSGEMKSEIDIFENTKGGDDWIAAMHSNKNFNFTTEGKQSFYTPDLSEGFHTYGLLWTEETITWYVDGVAVHSVPTPDYMHQPMYMIVNLAIDSNIAADFAGADLKVDYVRAYSLEEAPQVAEPAAPVAIVDKTSSATTVVDAGKQYVATTGNDTFIITSTKDRIDLSAVGGKDTVRSSIDYVLPDSIQKLILEGNAIRGTGNDLDNTITGNALDNVLSGGAGNDILNGGLGADTMIGGIGNDTYYVDNIGDKVIEKSGEGTDKVIASIDYALTDNVENLTLTGTAIRGTGNDLNNTITGNALDNILIGGGGNDILKGGLGADTMIGGTGNDVYYVDNIGDKVIEKAGEGIDKVMASIDYVLPDNVENLTLQDGAIRGTGNALNNSIIGNAADNFLSGGAGNDVLNGGAGADTMYGGTGNDIYYVDNAGDKVIEYANEGTDKVIASIDYVLTDNVENLTLTGDALRGSGNALNNVIVGNALDNILHGGAGNDNINGGAGNDWINGGTGNDILTGGTGNDVFVFDGAFGADQITDFNVDEDKIFFTNTGGSAASLQMKKSGTGTLVTVGANSVLIKGVSIDSLVSHHVFDHAFDTASFTAAQHAMHADYIGL